MKLYGYPPTRSTRVLWTLRELDVEFEFVNVDLEVLDRLLEVDMPVGVATILARVEWHPPDFNVDVVHRGVTLYERAS